MNHVQKPAPLRGGYRQGLIDPARKGGSLLQINRYSTPSAWNGRNCCRLFITRGATMADGGQSVFGTSISFFPFRVLEMVVAERITVRPGRHAVSLMLAGGRPRASLATDAGVGCVTGERGGHPSFFFSKLIKARGFRRKLPFPCLADWGTVWDRAVGHLQKIFVREKRDRKED